jgi:hypothetical protein
MNTPSFIQRLTEIENIMFFIAGVTFAGFISGICTFYHARQRAKKLVVNVKV